MDETKEFLKEDGYLAVNDCSEIHKIIFHPNLNVILIFTNSTLLILDVNSGVVLQRVAASGSYNYLSFNYFLADPAKETDGKRNLTKKGEFSVKSQFSFRRITAEIFHLEILCHLCLTQLMTNP